VDLLSREHKVEFKQVYWANYFVREIQENLQVPIQIEFFNDLSCQYVESKLASFEPE